MQSIQRTRKGMSPMLPINPTQIPNIYNQALRLQSAGKLEEALQAYSTILNVRPNLPQVHFQVGRIFQKAGQFSKAAKHLQLAKAASPKELAIWTALGECLTAGGDPKQTREFLKSIKGSELNPDEISSLLNRFGNQPGKGKTNAGSANKSEIIAAIKLLEKNEFEAAEKLASSLHLRHPNVAIIADVLANAQARLNKAEAAKKSFEKAIQLDPKYAEAKSNYGGFLLETGDIDEAIKQSRAALKLAPNMPIALQTLGAALNKSDQHVEAQAPLRRALEINPDHSIANWQLGVALSQLRNNEEAVKYLRKAIKLGIHGADVHATLGKALDGLGRDKEALEEFAAAIEIDPTCAEAFSNRAFLRQSQGDFDAADADFRKAMELSPDNGSAFRAFVTSNKLKPDDPLIDLMVSQFERTDIADSNRKEFGFALAKVFEDTKQYGKVFKYLNAANSLVRKQHPYEISSRRKEIDLVKKAFCGVDLERTKTVETVDYAPIFITGMPRSGTTLVEQIVASHSEVTAGGEVGKTVREAIGIMGLSKDTSRHINDIDLKEIKNFGRFYSKYMRNILPGSTRVTDKSIQSYLALGLIKMAMPNAKMIIVRRDPRDNLLSIYKNVFAGGSHGYAYNLRDLGLYFKMFVEMIDFWREINPDWFYEIQYEDLISNPEKESRKLIAACGLEWEDACLKFHQTERKVKTLSVYQVRQPIYKTSFNLWEQYKDELGELFEALK